MLTTAAMSEDGADVIEVDIAEWKKLKACLNPHLTEMRCNPALHRSES